MMFKEKFVSICHKIHEKGWVANHDGNVSLRLTPQRILCTPTAESKSDISEDLLIVVDDQGKVVEGGRKPFSELCLHLCAYRVRADINCVIHSHSPYATALSVLGLGLETPLGAEFVVSLGDRIPLVPYALPGTDEFHRSLERPISEANGVILENHGIVTVGVDLDQAFYRMELIEHAAKVFLFAQSIGKPHPIPQADVRQLIEKRRKAGLEPPGYRSMENDLGPSKAGQPAYDSSLIGLIEEVVLSELTRLHGRR